MGLFGFTQSLAREGEKRNIRVNCIAPIAGTRMTETVMAPEIITAIKTDYILPLVGYLTHESCEETGSLFEVGAGYIGKLRWERTEGGVFDIKGFTPEKVKAEWNKIVDFENHSYPESLNDTLAVMMNNVERNQKLAAAEPKEEDDGLLASKIFNMMGNYLAQGLGKATIPKVESIYQFDITLKKGGKIVGSWVIDLKNGDGKVTKGKSEAADAIFLMTDENFNKVCLGTLNPQMAFLQGKMKIKGNMSKASKFTPQLFPPPNEENMKKFGGARI